MRDLLLIFLGMAVVPLSEHIWDILKSIIKIIPSLFKRKHTEVCNLWEELRMGIKHSLGGMITAIVIIGILYFLLYSDTQNTKRFEEARQINLIESMNKNNTELINAINNAKQTDNQKFQDLIDRIDKVLEQNTEILQRMEVQYVSGNITATK